VSASGELDWTDLAEEIASGYAHSEQADCPSHIATDAQLTAVALIEGFCIGDDEQRRARHTVLSSLIYRNGPAAVGELVNALAAFAHTSMTLAASEHRVPMAEQIGQFRGAVIAMGRAEEQIEQHRAEGDGHGTAR
jgi:hypothetical protein